MSGSLDGPPEPHPPEPHQDQPKASPQMLPPQMLPPGHTVPVTREARTSFRNGTLLEDECKAVTDDVRYKTEVSFDDFIKTFVPNVLENLSLTPVLDRMQKIEAWKEFSSSLSADASSENRSFKQLTPLFDKIVEAAQYVWNLTCPEQQWSLVTESTATPNSSERPPIIKPDAFFYHKAYSHLQSPYSYFNIAFAADSKCGGTDSFLDNTSKLVYAMRHIMAVDARRCFMFGFTIKV